MATSASTSSTASSRPSRRSPRSSSSACSRRSRSAVSVSGSASWLLLPFVLGLLLPVQSYLTAQSRWFDFFYLLDTRWALILPYIGLGLSLAVFLLKGYLDTLPRELFEAARIDGAGDFRMLVQIVLPLMRPGLATVATFSILSCWNEFLLAMLYVQSDELRTIPDRSARLHGQVLDRLPDALRGTVDHHHPDDRHLRRLPPSGDQRDHRGLGALAVASRFPMIVDVALGAKGREAEMLVEADGAGVRRRNVRDGCRDASPACVSSRVRISSPPKPRPCTSGTQIDVQMRREVAQQRRVGSWGDRE